MSDLVKAYWNCGFPVEVAGQGAIGFGDAAMIPKGEADDSDNWRLSAPPKPRTTPAPEPDPPTEENA